MWNVMSTCRTSLRPFVHIPTSLRPSVHILRVLETFCPHVPYRGDLSTLSMTFCPHSPRHWNFLSTYSISWRPSVHILRVLETFCPHSPRHGDLLSTCCMSWRPSVLMLDDLLSTFSTSLRPRCSLIAFCFSSLAFHRLWLCGNALVTRVSMTDPSSYVQLLMPPPATIGSKTQYVLRPSVRCPFQLFRVPRSLCFVQGNLSQILITGVGVAETFFNVEGQRSRSQRGQVASHRLAYEICPSVVRAPEAYISTLWRRGSLCSL